MSTEFQIVACFVQYANSRRAEHETERVEELSKQIGVPLTVKNFVQSHTPFQQLVHDVDGRQGLKDKVVLVTGGHGS